MSRRYLMFAGLAIATLPLVTFRSSWSYEVNEQLSIEVVGTTVIQYGDFEDADTEDTARGTAVIDLGIGFRPTPSDEFNVIVSFAEGNALNQIAPLSLAPYADDLEDDLKDINNSDRDYLLTAWYKHLFGFNENASLALTGGIIDATAYLDVNLFANDEVTQFMNDIFVNNTLLNLPSYDFGIATELALYEDWTVSVVWINSETENEDPISGRPVGESFNHFGGQLAYHAETAIGPGNYRIVAYTTDESFAGPGGGELEALRGVGLSLDQQITEEMGVFARLGWQDDEGAIDHDALFSVGLRLGGILWGRSQDEVGLAYAHLSGADDSGLADTDVVETYIKFGMSEWTELSVDLQYIYDDTRTGPDPEALIFGGRLGVFF